MSIRIAFVLTLASSAASAQDPYAVDRAHSEVTFRIRHLVSKVSGRFDDFSDNPGASSVQFVTKTASVNTANANRDAHLKSADLFDVEKSSEIRFQSIKIAPVDADTFNVTGSLAMQA